jgi:hypothetical protein
LRGVGAGGAFGPCITGFCLVATWYVIAPSSGIGHVVSEEEYEPNRDRDREYAQVGEGEAHLAPPFLTASGDRSMDYPRRQLARLVEVVLSDPN